MAITDGDGELILAAADGSGGGVADGDDALATVVDYGNARCRPPRACCHNRHGCAITLHATDDQRLRCCSMIERRGRLDTLVAGGHACVSGTNAIHLVVDVGQPGRCTVGTFYILPGIEVSAVGIEGAAAGVDEHAHPVVALLW